MIGGTDSSALVGIADDIYRFQPVRMSIPELAMIHGKDERISRQDLRNMIAFYMGVVRDAQLGAGR